LDNMQTIFDMGFRSGYSVAILPGLPAVGGTVHQFHRQGQRTHSEGLVIRVGPRVGEAWVGNFQGSASRTGLNGGFATPSENDLCVVSEGQGYWVRADEPRKYLLLECDPVVDVRRVPCRDLVVFADFTRLVAYGPNGLVWRTEALSYDGVTISEVGKELIRGVAWDPTVTGGGGTVEFCVETDTGHHTGGAAFIK